MAEKPNPAIRDAALRQRLSAGGSKADDALVELDRLHRIPLMAFLCRRGASVDEAENLVQDTWLKVRAASGEFRGESKLGSWIYSIAKNLLLDLQRRESRWVDPHELRTVDKEGEDVDMLTTLADAQANSPSIEDEVERRRFLKCYEDHFPTFQRDHPDRAEDLELIVSNDWSTAELAAFRDIEPAAMRKRLQRTRALLRSYLAPCEKHWVGRLL